MQRENIFFWLTPSSSKSGKNNGLFEMQRPNAKTSTVLMKKKKVFQLQKTQEQGNLSS